MKRTEETRKLIALHNGMHRNETKDKLRAYRTGKHWYNNGKISIAAVECPEGFVKGLLRKKREDGKTQNN